MMAHELSEGGIIYCSRRKFLASGNNCLRPPRELKTRRQTRREHLQGSTSFPSVIDDCNTISTKGSNQSIGHISTRRRDSALILKSILAPTPKHSASRSCSVSDYQSIGSKIRRAAENVIERMHYLDDKENERNQWDREDWEEHNSAGVHYWVNKISGDVSAKCPWTPYQNYQVGRNLGSSGLLDSNRRKEAADEGTGSLVYSDEEIHELFAILDQLHT